jgi:hypothetical protein
MFYNNNKPIGFNIDNNNYGSFENDIHDFLKDFHIITPNFFSCVFFTLRITH